MLNLITEALEEFKKVQWPTKKQTIRLTVYVISGSLLVGLFLTGLDYVFKELLEIILR